MTETNLIAHVERAPLANAMARLAKLAPHKATLPILGHVLIDASEASVRLMASNLETTVQITMPADVEIPGQATIPARLLEQVIRADRGPRLTLSTSELTTTLAQEGNRPYMTFIGLDPAEFPHAPALGAQITHLKAGALQHAAKQVLPCVDPNGIDYFIDGVYLDIQADYIAVVAANKHRMALTEVPATTIAPTGKLVGLTAAIQIALLPADAPVDIYATETGAIAGGLALVTDTTTVYVRPVDAEYPPYRAIIPTEHRIFGTIDRRALLASAKRVRKAADRACPHIRFDCDQTQFTLQCSNRDGITASETLAASFNEPMQFALNAKYLIDVLAVFDGNTLWWGMNDPLAAIMLHDASAPYPVAVIMPIRYRD